MDKIEEFRKLVATLVNYQVISGNTSAIPEEDDFAVIRSISEDSYISNRITYDSDTGAQVAHRETSALLQIDFYSTDKVRAKEIAQDMLDILTFKSRDMILNKGFGIKDVDISLQDRTFIENVEYIHRYGFDINIAFVRTIERNPATRIDNINIKANNEDIEI